jgi:hypothetical protein
MPRRRVQAGPSGLQLQGLRIAVSVCTGAPDRAAQKDDGALDLAASGLLFEVDDVLA